MFMVLGAVFSIRASASGTIKVKVSHEPGAYLGGFTLSFTAGNGTDLFYTTDGSKPKTWSLKVPESGIEINSSCTIRVLARKDDLSKFYRYEYTIVGKGNSADKTKKYYYNYLKNKQKKAYNLLSETISSHSPSIKLYDLNISEEEWAYAYEAFFWDEPALKSVWDNEKTLFGYYAKDKRMADTDVFYYTRTEDAADRRISEMEKVAAEIAAEAMKFPDDASKVRYVTDWLVYNVKYDESDPSSTYTAYGALVKKKAVCKGYADAFTYIMQILEIPVLGCGIYVRNNPYNYHAANMVQIDGHWCNIDVTWTDNTTDKVCLDYYLVSDNEYEKTHTKVIDGYEYPPEVPMGATNQYNKEAVREDKESWSYNYSQHHTTRMYIDVNNSHGDYPYSFLVNNEGKDIGFLQRTFAVEPSSQYRLTAYCAFSGDGGAYIGDAYFNDHSEKYSSEKWGKLTYEFKTESYRDTVDLGLFNGIWSHESKGRAWFADIKLQKYENGKWVTVYSDMPVGSGFGNYIDVIKPLDKLEFDRIANRKYTGKLIKPAVTIRDGDYTLREGIDYTASYSNNKKPGTATVTVTGKGLYYGTYTLEFKIVKK